MYASFTNVFNPYESFKKVIYFETRGVGGVCNMLIDFVHQNLSRVESKS